MHEPSLLFAPETEKMQQFTRPLLMTLLLGILAALVLAGCSGSGSISDKKIEYIDLNQAVDYYEQRSREEKKALFIDTRKPERFAQGHLPGARNIRGTDIKLEYGLDPTLERYDNLIVYGENPGSAGARAMAKRLIQAGYNTMLKKRVKLFLGGWVEWDTTGLDIETSELPSEENKP